MAPFIKSEISTSRITNGRITKPFFQFSLQAVAVAGLLFVVGCSEREPDHAAKMMDNSSLQTQVSPAARPGGDTTVNATGTTAFSLPAANLTISQRADFQAGNSFFRQPWVVAPASAKARDGLGPLFNVNACQSCHIRDGRGHAPQSVDDDGASFLVKLAIPPQTAEQQAALDRGEMIFVEEPNYGGQFNDRAIPGVPREGRIALQYETKTVALAGGETAELQRPIMALTDLNYGELHPDTAFSGRLSPPVIGMGLLDALAGEDIVAGADPDDADGNGISGRPNRVWDSRANKPGALGRFGWKAATPTVEQQAAGAFAGDIGITSALNAGQPCTATQIECVKAPHGGEPEVSEVILDLVTFYTQHLAVPARRNMADAAVQRGEQQFAEAGCAGCHRPQWQTGELADRPTLSNQTIFPYTDMLLHDMGSELMGVGLADGVPAFAATGAEWRTAPLWGLGYAQEVSGDQPVGYLHDGRARTPLEAILWHGGEAKNARDAVVAMSPGERADLLEFLNSL